MDEYNSDVTVKTLIQNILLTNIDNIDVIKEALIHTTDLLDIAMILLAIDVSNIKSNNLFLINNQFKNVLLEQYLNNTITNETIPIKQENCQINEIDDEEDTVNYNLPGSPIKIYGEESDDGFIYIDDRHVLPYEPLIEEKAMKFVFLEKKLLPPTGSKAHIDQRFDYITDEGEKRMCIRRFVIDSNGHVVKYLGEHTKPINTDNPLITKEEGFEPGVLADLLHISNEEE